MDEDAAGSGVDDGQAAGAEPGGERVEVGLSGTVEFANLLRGEPVMIVGRSGVLLVGEELGEGSLALGGAGEDEGEVEWQGVRNLALVAVRRGPGRDVADESGGCGEVGVSGDAVRLESRR